MKTYKCRYRDDAKSGTPWLEIEADSPKAAYEEYLSRVGVKPCPVVVEWGNMITGGDVTIDEHIRHEKNVVAKIEATKTAEASATPTDMLLKQLLVEQKRSNELLEKLRRIANSFWWWFIGSVLIIIAVSLLGRGCKAIVG